MFHIHFASEYKENLLMKLAQLQCCEQNVV